VAKKRKLKRFSVLLLYPDYMAETFGHDTTFVRVNAEDDIDAVRKAQRKAVRSGECDVGAEDDFYPLLVVRGHKLDYSWRFFDTRVNRGISSCPCNNGVEEEADDCVGGVDIAQEEGDQARK